MNEVNKNDTASSFVPKPFKEYKLDLSEFAFYQEKSDVVVSNTPKNNKSTSQTQNTKITRINKETENSDDSTVRSTTSSKKTLVKTAINNSINKNVSLIFIHISINNLFEA